MYRCHFFIFKLFQFFPEITSSLSLLKKYEMFFLHLAIHVEGAGVYVIKLELS